MSCTPSLQKKELRWGFLTSILSGGTNAAALFYAGYKGWDPKVSYPLIMFVVGLFGHALDILIAKRCFGDWRNPGQVNILGYTAADFARRVAWYARSLVSMSFVRHLMLAMLDALVVGKLTEIATEKLDAHRAWVDQKWIRDPLVATFIGLITFNLYVNVLRFAWVYNSDPNLSITVIVSMWLVGVMYYQLDSI